MKKVLISGGSGLLGSYITKLLLQKGVKVSHLSTRKNYRNKGVEVFYWNPKEQFIDEAAFEEVDTLIHLAGSGVADKPWTKARKKDLIDSRVQSSKLLMKILNEGNHRITQFIGASAIGYYGDSDKVLTEEVKAGDDFLAQLCNTWEESYQIDNPDIAKIIFRIGIVLANEGGALPEMTQTLPFFVGILGDGKQIYSWIHINDLARMFLFAMENKEMKGVYNAVAPHPVAQKELAKTIAKHKKSLLIPAPKFGLKLVLGEMSSVLFMSQNCSSKKIEQAGFKFNFKTSSEMIADLM